MALSSGDTPVGITGSKGRMTHQRPTARIQPGASAV